jgi:hypothetical protein
LSLRIDVWHWFSLDQAISATTLSRKAGELEANPNPPSETDKASGLKWSVNDQRAHRSYVTASILSSVTFLEASINELFASARYDNLEVGGKLSQQERDHLTGAAEMIANNRLLDRFQLALYLLDRTPFDRGGSTIPRFPSAGFFAKRTRTLQTSISHRSVRDGRRSGKVDKGPG